MTTRLQRLLLNRNTAASALKSMASFMIQSTTLTSVILSFTLLSSWGVVQADTKVRSSSFEYNAQGLLTKEIVEPDSPNDCLQTSYTYDGFGNQVGSSRAICAGATGNAVLSATVARTTTLLYGANGRFPVSTSNALSQSEAKTYDGRFGVVSSLTGPNGLMTTWQYDSFGRKTRETRADGTYTSWTYSLCTDAGVSCPNSVGPATVTWVAIEHAYAANAVVSAPEKRQYYDSLNRVVRIQTQGFDGTSGVAAPTLLKDTEYNALGQIARQSRVYASTDSPMWVSFVYDALGRIASESHPDAGGIAVTTNDYSALTTIRTQTVASLNTGIQNGQWSAPTITASQGPSPWIATQPATLSWGSTNASVVTYKCTSSGTGFTLPSQTVALSGTSASVMANEAWAGAPSTCVFTAAGPGGTATYSLTVNTLPAPVFNFSPTIASDIQNYNLRAAAVAAGWDQVKPLKATVTINSAVVISASSTSNYAFDTGASFPAGSTLTLINNGYIIGMGGAGGSGGRGVPDTSSEDGHPGFAGGPAFRAQHSIAVTNNGTIGGGGGGGGGGGSGDEGLVSGGGGGGGRSGRANAAGGWNGGGTGTYSSAGGGAAGGCAEAGGGYCWDASGPGAAGGGWGSAGSAAPVEGDLPGGIGGAGGAAVVGNANVTWAVTGVRLGALQ
jgi:YD repeat-containing protein